MDVRELITKLLECPMDKEVYLYTEDGDSVTIDDVDFRYYNSHVHIKPKEPIISVKEADEMQTKAIDEALEEYKSEQESA